MTAAAMATAAPAKAPLLRLEPPLTQTCKVLAGAAGAGALDAGTTAVVMTAAGAGAAVVVTTQMGVSGTTLVVQGMTTVTVASLQVVAGSSQLVQTSVVVQSRGTHSVAVQVTVVVHQSHLGRTVADLGGG
jgi:hypothetical protein